MNEKDFPINEEKINTVDGFNQYAIPDEPESILAAENNNLAESDNNYKPAEEQESLDQYAIPDEEDSIAALKNIREIENNIVPISESDLSTEGQGVDNKVYKITEEEVDHRADVTGQSYGSILKELNMSEADVRPADKK